MTPVLDRLARLLALTESPNENEARNAAVLAVRLIRQHRVQLTLPPGSTTPAPTRKATPSPTTPRRRTPASAKNRRIVDIPAEIKSPLGGDCVECGGRYRAGSSIYWLPSGGGLHTRCLEDWTKRGAPKAR